MTRVLLVDDAAAFSLLITHWLADCHGIELVGVAKSPEEALEEARAKEPEVILLDHLLGEQTSEQVTPRLREAAPTAKVVLVSGMAPDELERVAAASGADAALPKSSTADDICDAILRAAGKPPRHS